MQVLGPTLGVLWQLAFPVTSTESQMSPMTSGNRKLSLACGGGSTSWEGTGTRMQCRRSVSEEAVPVRTPGSPRRPPPPCFPPRALPRRWKAAHRTSAERERFHRGGGCCVKSQEPGTMKFVFSGAKGHSTNEVYMSSHGATERHVSKLCRPARERNRDTEHSDAGRS